MTSPSYPRIASAYRLEDKFVWDFWIVQYLNQFHLFYLQSERAGKTEQERHWDVSIGHAQSLDLEHWEQLPDAFGISSIGEYEELTTWTGSIIYHDNLWYCFYTSTFSYENGRVQRVCLAVSEDLESWTKYPGNPVLGLDSRYYETFDESPYNEENWRDPWIFQDDATGLFHMYITARDKQGVAEGRGVIAHAESANLLDWLVSPPVAAPGLCRVMECPQLVRMENRYYLLFSTMTGWHTLGHYTGIYYMMADNPYGPFSDPLPLYTDEHGTLYAGKIQKGSDARWYFVSWRQFGPDGEFYGDVAVPIPVHVKNDGSLRLTFD